MVRSLPIRPDLTSSFADLPLGVVTATPKAAHELQVRGYFAAVVGELPHPPLVAESPIGFSQRDVLAWASSALIDHGTCWSLGKGL